MSKKNLNTESYIEIINSFSQIIQTNDSVDDTLWSIAKNTISQLEFTDCVIYLIDESKEYLIQRAAYGNKNPNSREILDPIKIKVGKGIVGNVALSKKSELIIDTSQDKRYIQDDMSRLSEIAVPIIHEDQLLGVIDSEHPEKNFFTKEHLEILNIIAAIAATKLIQTKYYDQLKEKEERFRKLFENSMDIICITSYDGTIKFITPAVTILMGYPVKELINQNIFNYIHPDNQKEARERFVTRYKEGGEGEYRIFKVKTKSGKYKHLRMIISNHFNEPSIKGFIINAHDVTGLIAAEKEKYKAIFDTRENERNRISHDLHDGLGQTIAAANMYMNFLNKNLTDKIDKETYSIFQSAQKLINEATQETRIISHNFMPRSLKQYGLENAIENLLGHYDNIKKEIRLKLISNIGNNRLEDSIELTIFRITQELVSNAIKHAKPSQINVKLNLFKNNLTLKVSDNGVGFNTENIKTNKKAGIGLTGIRERVFVLDGKLTIDSSEATGTSITVSIEL